MPPSLPEASSSQPQQPQPARQSPYADYNDQAQTLDPEFGAPQPTMEQQSPYENTLPMRIDIEAACTYLFGTFTGILFLILEHKNDYVRFHAWQSCLIFTPLLLLHACFMYVSWMTWLLVVVDVGFMLGLGWKAYTNGQTLHRYKVPWVGPIASRWTDMESTL